MVGEILKKSIQKSAQAIGFSAVNYTLEHPASLKHGDYASNVALILATELGAHPREIAEKIIAHINLHKPEEVERVEVAGPGFINFHLSREFFMQSIAQALEHDEQWGKNDRLAGQKVMVEYTDPNPFKEFHIGHLMSNTIGESIARLLEFTGAEVKRANWQGDIGPHVAKAIWAKIEKPELQWGEAYTYGSQVYEENKQVIDEINKKIYDKSDSQINALYEQGRKESLEHFERIYHILGTTFDYYFFESREGLEGAELVKEFLGKGVFEESNGAVVFRGEKHGLHTRVFLTAHKLPTYEAKELGLNKAKFEKEPDLARSIIVTANEQSNYFRVVLKAMEFIFPTIAEKTEHIAHGMMRLASGKMSSRKGNIVTGESLLDDVKARVDELMKGAETDSAASDAEIVAVAAVKYSILKQSLKKNITFDVDASLSFEGDSGPYLQYAYTRAQAILRRADEAGHPVALPEHAPPVTDIERMLYRFPEVVERAAETYEPHHVATYLTELAGVFNSWYARERVLDGSSAQGYKLALTQAVSTTLQNGLFLLGIRVPERM
jgi:arginyl-tRNA synthetase